MRPEARMALACFAAMLALAFAAAHGCGRARATDLRRPMDLRLSNSQPPRVAQEGGLPTYAQAMESARWSLRQLDHADRLVLDHALAVRAWRAMRPVAVEEGRIP